jgi:hypothetical protein
MSVLEFEGAVVDSAAYLDGTREYMIEAEAPAAGEPWRLTLSFRWPKDHDTPLEEGDLTVSGGAGAELLAALRDGTAAEMEDEDTGAESVELALSFTVSSAEGPLVGVERATLRGTVLGEDARLVLELPGGALI